MDLAVALTVAYLVGSVPFAWLLASRRGIDLRAAGSRNVGASNVLRTTGVRNAVLAMCLDGLKGAAAVLLADRLSPGTSLPVLAGVTSVVGHVFPVWLRFRGGKGVATAAGVFAVLAPVALSIGAAVFVLAVWVTRYISVGSIAGALTLALAVWLAGRPLAVSAGAAAVTILILARHRDNLARLASGTERRVGQRLF